MSTKLHVSGVTKRTSDEGYSPDEVDIYSVGGMPHYFVILTNMVSDPERVLTHQRGAAVHRDGLIMLRDCIDRILEADEQS